MADKSVPKYLPHSLKVIDRWISYKRFFKRIPGVSLGLVYKNETVFVKGYGVESLKTKKQTTEFTNYRIGSISKLFTATAIMQLVEGGKLQLDDTVKQYLPWLNSKITIRQLLSHSSGIDRDGDTSHWVDDKFPTLEVIKKHLKQGIKVYPPLKRFKYSNLGYALLGEVVHIASGKPYDEYVNENIIKKLGLNNTYSDLNSRVKSQLASGHSRDIPNEERIEFNHVSTHAMASATGFVSHVVDLCKFLSAQFQGNNKLVTDLSKREMQRVQWMRKDDQEHYGLGYEIWKMNGKQIIGHSGGFPGFLTQISMDKEDKIGVVVLTNTNGVPTYELTDGMFHIIKYFKDNKEKFQTSNKKISSKRYEGRFSSRWGDFEIVEVNGHLLGFWLDTDKPLEEPFRFEYLDGDSFRIIEANEFDYIGEKARFVFDGTEKLTRLYLGPTPMEISDIDYR